MTPASPSSRGSGPFPMQAGAPALLARGMEVCLDQRRILGPFDLEMPSGTWTSLVGPNGAGKSTLLKALAGLLPHGGDVFWHGTPRDGRAPDPAVVTWPGWGMMPPRRRTSSSRTS